MKFKLGMLLSLAALLVAGCNWGRGGHALPELTVVPIAEAAYICSGAARITARYSVLSDKTLHFVHLDLPDGGLVALPNAVSASGARYTDEREYVWWVSGRGAFLEKRDEDGEWRRLYEDCREES